MDTTSSFISAATNGALARIPPLQSTTYRQWSFAMKFLLDGEDLWELTINGIPDDAEIQLNPQASRARTRSTRSPTMQASTAPTDAEKRKAKKAAFLIYQSCTPTPQSYIANEKDPARMWSILEDLYSRVHDDEEAGHALFEEFWAEQFHKYKSIDEYGAKLKTYQDQLAHIADRRLTDSNLTLQLIKGLPQHYDDVVMLIRMNKPRVTFHQALKLLAERERTLGIRRQAKALIAGTNNNQSNNDRGKNRDNRQNDQQNNQQNDSNRGSNNRGRGSYRGRYRHRGGWRNHRDDRRRDNRSSKDKKSVCTHCGWTGHPIEECRTHKRAQRRLAENLKEVHANTATTTPAATALTTFTASDVIDAAMVDAEAEYCSLSSRITFVEDED